MWLRVGITIGDELNDGQLATFSMISKKLTKVAGNGVTLGMMAMTSPRRLLRKFRSFSWSRVMLS